MWKINTLAILLVISSLGSSEIQHENKENLNEKDPLLPTTDDGTGQQTTTNIKPSVVEIQPEDISTQRPTTGSLPISSENVDLPAPISQPEEYKRRVITYDQRQEGQYNIRADLENFMIVLIPPNQSEGINLLDLLTRSSVKSRSNPNKQQKKHQLAPKYSPSMKNNNFNSFRQQSLSLLENPSARISEFIEGRTPYRVDISSTDGDPNRLHPDSQVDVLPPPYPLYNHLIKPYHLEAEPNVIQALPPPSVGGSPGNFLDNYFNDYPNDEANNFAKYFRLGRSIDGRQLNIFSHSPYPIAKNMNNFNYLNSDKPIASNTISTTTTNQRNQLQKRNIPDSVHLQQNTHPFYNSFDSLSTIDGFDEIRSRTMDLHLAGEDNNNDNNAVQNYNIDNNWELKLLGATENCGPDRKRDSYGICRFIQNY